MRQTLYSRHWLRSRKMTGLSLAVAAALYGSQSVAQTYLEEVIVTAQKRTESLQDTPLSISALTADALEQRDITNTEQLIDNVAGLHGFDAPGSRGATSLNIRGFGGGSPANLSLDPAVGVYLDGVYLGKMTGSGMDVAELERVEVLRGPQGTLYGRNSTAGAVNFISRKPTGEFGMRVKGTLGNYDQRRINVNGDLPAIGDIGEGLGRLSASFGYQMRKRDDIYDGVNSRGWDDIDRDAWRVALLWQPAESITIDYSYDHSELDENQTMQQVVSFVPMGADSSINRVDALQGLLMQAQGWAAAPGTDPRIVNRWVPSLQRTIDVYSRVESDGASRPSRGGADFPRITENEVDGHALTFNWEAGDLGALGEVSLKSITGYREMESYVFGDLENIDSRLDDNGIGAYNDLVHFTLGQLYGFTSGYQGFDPGLDAAVNGIWTGIDAIGAYHSKQDTLSEYEQFSQEFQMLGSTDRMEYLLGLYYFEDEAEYSRNAGFVTPLNGIPHQYYELTGDSWAVFGQSTWRPEGFDDRLALTLGMRYTEESKEIFYDYAENITPFGITPAQTTTNEENFYNFSGNFTLAYDLTDDLSTYLRYATGYRSGGFNGEQFNNAFDEETIEQWEWGVKSDWWNNRLRINGALYTYEYDDLQMSQTKTDGGSITSMIANAGKTERWGGELEVLISPLEDLILSASYTYVTGDFEEYPEICGTNLPQTCLRTDNRAKGPTPSNQVNMTADYVFARTNLGDITGFIQIDWRDEWTSLALSDGVVQGEPVIYEHNMLDARTLVNARFSLENMPVGNGTMSISLWGKNLTDNDYPTFTINFGSSLGLITEQYGEPRTYGLDVKYEF